MEKRNVHQRLAAAMQEVTYVQKEDKPGMNYTIVSHDRVTAKVRPALLKHGIVYYPVDLEHDRNGNRISIKLTVRFVNIDDPADFFDVPAYGDGIDKQDKGPGKATSYAVKYALLKAMGLETGDDPDYDDIDHGPDPQEQERQAREEAEAQRIIAGLEACTSRDEGVRINASAPPNIKARPDYQRAVEAFSVKYPKAA